MAWAELNSTDSLFLPALEEEGRARGAAEELDLEDGGSDGLEDGSLGFLGFSGFEVRMSFMREKASWSLLAEASLACSLHTKKN